MQRNTKSKAALKNKMKKYDPLAQYQLPLQPQTPSFWRRTLAFLLDMALLSITVLAPVSTLLEHFVPTTTTNIAAAYDALTQNQSTSTVITVVMLFISLLVVLYFTLCEYLLGQTAGKRLLDLKVETIEGARPTFWRCLVRNLIFLPIFPFILFWIIDPLYLLFSKQRLSEQLSRTRTVNYIKEQTVNSG